jgi:hypothetical protein
MYDQQKTSQLMDAYQTKFQTLDKPLGCVKVISLNSDGGRKWNRLYSGMENSLATETPLTEDDCYRIVGDELRAS